ncbi:hypothetical protein HFO32_22100 [Rhizobium leguminosarum]|uniref:hypothetical protein n=1 Tax=Rhizobium leguminosarum TaxID=384 RepID=UPI001C96105C|nr:hypothetical protein [Rhizobium leguminosarum]MBY5684818.1 hypothetical protein [Rhizobium leguminosarum]
MPKLPKPDELSRQLRYDVANLTSSFEEGLSVYQVLAQRPGWGIARVKRARKQYLADRVLNELARTQETQNTTVFDQKTPKTPPKVGEIEKPPLREIDLHITPGQSNGIVAFHISPSGYDEALVANLWAFCNAYCLLFLPLAKPADRDRFEKFPQFIQDHIVFDNIRLGEDILIISDAGKALSVDDPITHLMTAHGGKHVVVAHPAIAMKSIPRLACDGAHFAWSTGSVTLADSEKDRTQCQALFIQIASDGMPFFHQLRAAADGSFQYQNYYVADAGDTIWEDCRVKVAHWPDGHFDVMAPGVKNGLFGDGGLLDRLKPEVQVFEDILNFTDRSKFTRTSTELARQHHLNRGSVRKEIEATAAFLNSCRRDWTTIYKIEDNHGARLIEWLEGDQRRDPLPDNVKFWARMLVAKHQMLEDDPEDFRLAYLEHEAMLQCGLAGDIRYVWRGQSLKVDGVEHGVHFHKGINGSPGNSAQYRNLGYPIVGGHPHSPSIMSGVTTVGTAGDLNEKWDPDATTKAHALAIQYHNGHVVLMTQHPDGRVDAGPLVRVDQMAEAA